MIVLVSDTSVLIDLERAGLAEPALSLPHRFAVPDALYQVELAPYDGDRLLRAGLEVEELNGVELGRAGQIRQERPRLSVNDSLALALARSRGWMLLAGDRLLREAAAEHAVECHGVLWIIDELDRVAEVARTALAAGLQKLAAHPRCRLPKAELRARIGLFQDKPIR